MTQLNMDRAKEDKKDKKGVWRKMKQVENSDVLMIWIIKLDENPIVKVNYLYLHLLYSKFCFQGDDNAPMIHL